MESSSEEIVGDGEESMEETERRRVWRRERDRERERERKRERGGMT